MATPLSIHTEVTTDGWRLLDDSALFSLHSDTGPRVFTTFVAVPGKDLAYSIAFLPEHLHRLRSSAVASGTALSERLPSASRWGGAIAESLQNYRSKKPGIALIRLAIGAKRCELFIEPYGGGWSSPIDLISFTGRRETPFWKSTEADLSVTARQAAQTAGAHEALLYDAEGMVREGAWSNLFWFDSSGTLFTTYRDLLPGITRQALLRLTKCRLVEIGLAELVNTATEAFVTKSTTGITAVRAIDSRPLLACDKRTAVIRERFEGLVAGNLTVFGLEQG